MISSMSVDLWQELPYNFKDLNQFAFFKSVKTIFYLGNMKLNLSLHKSNCQKLSPIQFFQLFNLAIRLSTVPMFLFMFFQMIWRLTRSPHGFFSLHTQTIDHCHLYLIYVSFPLTKIQVRNKVKLKLKFETILLTYWPVLNNILKCFSSFLQSDGT